MIRAIEEHSLNAWPALQTCLQDGWVLRFAEGYTRRANSVNPLYPSEGDLAANIAACEAIYRTRGLPVIFKLTPASLPAGLDDVLARAGYRLEAPTSVQLVDLPADSGVPPETVHLAPALEDDWLDAFGRMASAAPARQSIHARLLRSILPTCAYASTRRDGQIVALGLGVLSDGILGLYDILTHPAYRRQGHAARIVAGLLAWAHQNGARQAYLQVMLDNQPALALYHQAGFRELYRYHYRVKA